MKKNLIYLLAAGTLMACDGKSNKAHKEGDSTHHMMAEHAHESQDPEVAAVMAIHDEIMPATSTILDLKKQLKSELARVDSLGGKNVEASRAEIENLITKLNEADRAMMEWMHQYKADTLSLLNDARKTAYLTDQKRRIESVRDLTRKSIDGAKTFIERRRSHD